ncbi:hypothetical protein [Bacillus sp. EAC]|uniref:hypothetical protein n=1 Tax=Bacillus sp. EAC TaxID=1978338 RepID=UPI000B44A212|nr:hypothetical protein [Bacillus sp. EAC]
MYPTESQDLYLVRLEDKLVSCISSALDDTKGQLKEHVIKRRFPEPMSNEDVQSIISAINKFTAMNKPLLCRRHNKEAFNLQNFESYLTQYRTLSGFYELPLENELVRSFTECD